MIERNLVYDHERVGIGLVPFPEEDANDGVPDPSTVGHALRGGPRRPARRSPTPTTLALVLWDPMENRVRRQRRQRLRARRPRPRQPAARPGRPRQLLRRQHLRHHGARRPRGPGAVRRASRPPTTGTAGALDLGALIAAERPPSVDYQDGAHPGAARPAEHARRRHRAGPPGHRRARSPSTSTPSRCRPARRSERRRRGARRRRSALVAVGRRLRRRRGVAALSGGVEPQRRRRVDAGLGPAGPGAAVQGGVRLEPRRARRPDRAPGRAGRSHLHDFFGNTTTDADSTADGLRRRRHDLPEPARHRRLLGAGAAPRRRAGDAHRVASPTTGPGPAWTRRRCEPYPAGPDDGRRRSHRRPQPSRSTVAAWHCGASPDLVGRRRPRARRTAPLGVRIAFPDCWDGEHLDSDDHRAPRGPQRRRRLPRRPPGADPAADLRGALPGRRATRPASSWPRAASHGVHADFLNAWDQAALEREVRVCLNGDKVCGVVSNRATG